MKFSLITILALLCVSFLGRTCSALERSLLPPQLLKLGLKIFKTEAALAAILGNIKNPERVFVVDRNISLVDMKWDSSIKKIKEEFISDVYQLKTLAGESGMIIDIGANIGAVSIHAALLHPKLRIIAIEPAPTTYFVFRINIFLNHVNFHQSRDNIYQSPGIYAYHAGVAADDLNGTITVTFSDSDSQFAVVGASSSKDNLRNWKTYEVQKMNVNKILAAASANDPIQLLKIDCEGCEFWLLPRISPVFKDKTIVHHVAGELHLSALDPTAPHAPDTVSKELGKATLNILKSRGCATDQWVFRC